MQSYRDVFNMRKHDPPEIQVSDPIIKSGALSKHHVYRIKGKDQFGEFECLRRYKEFDMFRDCLLIRF